MAHRVNDATLKPENYTTPGDATLYGGIRYLSKLSNEYECWAIFDGTTVEALGERRITIDDPDLVAVTARHGIPLT